MTTEKEIQIDSNLSELSTDILEQVCKEIDLFCIKVLYEKEATID